jgi:hypothetical protein
VNTDALFFSEVQVFLLGNPYGEFESLCAASLAVPNFLSPDLT